MILNLLMKVYFKIKFGAEKEKFESFGGGRYLVYLTMQKDDPTAFSYFQSIISRMLSVELKHIKYLGKNGEGNFEEHIFEI